MVHIDVNDNYLEFRRYYTVLFCMYSEKELSLDEFKK